MATEHGGAFAESVLAWFDRHGRHDLPWQRQPTPYRVWVSEIMLQQTQVQTVIPYFERFVAAFPQLTALADAPLDSVLSHWAGLGYYARARNLHRAARIVRDQQGGALPESLDELVALPGIGRSTAGAVLSLAHGQPFVVLDGNVKRVLARHAGIDGWPGRAPVLRQLWEVAETRLPKHRAGDYNQAMMDLGATLCTRRRPACEQCPLADDCVARANGDPERYPGRKSKSATPLRRTRMLVVRDAVGAVLLQRRPPAGIWGGLWSLPQLDDGATPDEWARWALGCGLSETGRLPERRHQFSHFRLDIEPLLCELSGPCGGVLDGDSHLWYKPGSDPLPGVPAPIKTLLQEYEEISE